MVSGVFFVRIVYRSAADLKKNKEARIKGKDSKKTKKQLVKEIEGLQEKIAKLEKDRKKVEKIKKELKAERDKFTGLLNSLSDGLDIIDENYHICFQNKMLIDRFGDLRGKLCFEVYMKRQVPCEFCQIKEAIKTRKTQRQELAAPDGRIYELTATPFKDTTGEIKVIEFVRDVTKSKKADAKIHESEKRFRELFDHMSSGVAVYESVDNGQDFIIKDFNRAAEKIDNIKRKIILGRSVLEIFPGVKEFGLFDVLKKVWNTGKPELFPVKLYKDKRIKGWREHFVYKLPSGEIVTIYDDITKRKQDEEKIEESEERFRKSIMNAPLPIMIHKENGKIISVNEAWTEITGYTKEEIPTIAEWTKKAYGKKKNLIKDDIDKLYKTNKRLDEGEFNIKTKDGSKRTWHFSSAPLGKAPDGLRLAISMALDVTERKEREREYKNLINGMNDTAFVISFEGKFIEINERAVEVLGYSRKELLKMGPTDIDTTLKVEEIKNLIEGMKRGERQVFPTTHKTKSGKIIPVEVSSSLISYMGKTVILSIARDITERKKAEESMRESEERLSAIFNNTSDLQLLFSLEEDGELRAVNVNKTAIMTARRLGLDVSKESFLGKTVKNIIKHYITPAEKDTEEIYKMFRSTAETGKPTSYEETYTFGDSLYSAEVTVVPVLDERGKCSHILWSSHDITERKQAEDELREREEQLSAIFNNTSDLQILFSAEEDGEFRIARVNETVIETSRRLGFDVSKVSFLGKTVKGIVKSFLSPVQRNPEATLKIFQKAAETGKPVFFDESYVFGNKHHYSEVTIIPILDKSGKCMYLLWTSHDITERKKVLEELKESEERFQTVIESLPHGVCLHDLDGRIILTNKATYRIIGYTQEEMLNMNVMDLDPGVRTRKEREKLWPKLKKGEFSRIESVHHRKDGSSFPVEINVSAISLKGKPMILAIVQDITERKEAQKKLKESEERFETVIENLPDEIFVNDLDGKFIMVNKASSEKTGYTKEELLKLEVSDIDHESISRDDRKNIWKKLQKKGGLERIESTHYRKDGSSYPAEIYIGTVTFKGNPMIIGIAHDITERKKAIEKLKESEERFQTVIEHLPHAVCVHDLDGNFILVNEALCKQTGFSRDEFKKMKVSNVDPNSQTREDRKKIWLHLKKGGHTNFESKLHRKDKSSYPVELYLSAVTLESAPMILAIAQDISERKSALENLLSSEEKYRTLYESMLDAFVRTDMQGNILEFNKKYLDMLGYTENEIRKLKCTDITPEKWHEMEERIKKEQILKKGSSEVYEKEYIKKDSTIFPVELRRFLLTDDNKNPKGIWATVRDISERRKTEEELRKVERLESLGVLAGGIAHDFNNLLTGILGNLSLAQMGRGEDFEEILEEAKQASLQAKNLTQQLLTFSKGGEPIKGEVNIGEIIRKSAEFSLHGSNVRCVYRFANDLWETEVDKGQMGQVIDNLVINSKQAMPEGGKIRIKAENVILDDNKSLPLPEDKYVKITLQDEGIGVPEEYLPKIFDPYFSTKQEGSGLGLASVYSIIQKHEGHITVESEPGKGTTFSIYLPAIEEKTSKEKREREKGTKRTPWGEGKILIMDDEKIVRRAVGSMLGRLGYLVEFAKNGEEAIAKYKEAKKIGDPFHAVILDLTIPGGMGGKKTLDKLLKIDPNVKAIVSSGYSNDPIMANYEKHGFKAVVAKPFDLKELDSTIKKVLE